MNQFKPILCFLLLSFSTAVIAQEEVLMTIDGQKVNLSEFERIYHKNSSIQTPTDSKGVQDYLELFINFKLKVIEAERMGLDTLQSFLTELNGYRDQLAKSYLKDTSYDEKLLLEAYERMHTDLNVSHILVRCAPDAPPADTVVAWNKINQIRKQLIKAEAFETIARASSEDANVKDNGGSLGWITAFSMPSYPFESAAYGLKKGELSLPVRTSFGYHLIRLNDSRLSPGEMKVAHIYKGVPPKSAPAVAELARKAIFAIADSIHKGYDFAKLASRNSDDKSSGKQGGELAWFGTGRMIPEFENAAFSLKTDGAVCEPIQSPYGWHIIKRLEQRGLQPYLVLRPQLKNQLNYSQRNLAAKSAWISQLKNEYGFKEYPAALEPYFSRIDSAWITAAEKADTRLSDLNAPLFKIGEKTHKQLEFTIYIQNKSRSRRGTEPYGFVKSFYRDFVDESVLAYEKTMLEKKYPDFRYLMEEYHDGILLFDLTDKMVWSRAVKDTLGLQEFFKANAANYRWNERLAATIYTCRDSAIALKAITLLTKKQKKQKDPYWLAKQICPEDTAHACIRGEAGKFEKGDHPVIDQSGWKPGIIGPVSTAGKLQIIVKNELIPPGPKSLQEARGVATADYQDYLEKVWIKELRSRYKVEIDQTVLAKVKP